MINDGVYLLSLTFPALFVLVVACFCESNLG